MMVCRSEFCLVISFVFFSSHSDGLRGSGYTVNTDVSVHPSMFNTHFPFVCSTLFFSIGFWKSTSSAHVLLVINYAMAELEHNIFCQQVFFDESFIGTHVFPAFAEQL